MGSAEVLDLAYKRWHGSRNEPVTKKDGRILGHIASVRTWHLERTVAKAPEYAAAFCRQNGHVASAVLHMQDVSRLNGLLAKTRYEVFEQVSAADGE
jgi:hypothetical protein